MRELTSNGVTIKCLASNLARHYFYQEFDQEIDEAVSEVGGSNRVLVRKLKSVSDDDLERFKNGDLTGLKKYDLRLEDFLAVKSFPYLTTLKVMWAMNKAARKADGLPVIGYEKWLEENDGFYLDEDVLNELWAEIEHGFFRKASVFGNI